MKVGVFPVITQDLNSLSLNYKLMKVYGCSGITSLEGNPEGLCNFTRLLPLSYDTGSEVLSFKWGYTLS